MRAFLGLVLVFVCSAAFGQGYVPYTPGSTAVVNQQIVNPQGMVPVQPGPGYGHPGLPVQEWRDGMREEFRNIHEIRPIQPWETAPQYQPQVYQQQQVVYPQYQQQWSYPAQQYYQQPHYYCPQQQYYCPQYRQPCYQYQRPSCWQNLFGW